VFERDLHLKETNADNEWHPKHIDVIAGLYICALVSTWVTSGKLFSVWGITASAGVFVYPLTCVFGDILTEIYGFNRTRRLIWIGFVGGLLYLIFTQIAIALPPAPAYKLQDAYAAINGSAPRIVIASYIAYVLCEFTNSFIMSKMKVWSKGSNFPLRAAASTVGAQLVDSVVFFSIAFIGVFPISVVVSTILSGWILKSVYEFVALPFTAFFVHWLKQLEGVEHFDRYKLKMLKF